MVCCRCGGAFSPSAKWCCCCMQYSLIFHFTISMYSNLLYTSSCSNTLCCIMWNSHLGTKKKDAEDTIKNPYQFLIYADFSVHIPNKPTNQTESVSNLLLNIFFFIFAWIINILYFRFFFYLAKNNNTEWCFIVVGCMVLCFLFFSISFYTNTRNLYTKFIQNREQISTIHVKTTANLRAIVNETVESLMHAFFFFIFAWPPYTMFYT